MDWIVPLRAQANTDQFRTTINTIFAEIEGAQAGYAGSLPAAEGKDGRLFVNNGDGKLYQLQSGSWVALT